MTSTKHIFHAAQNPKARKKIFSVVTEISVTNLHALLFSSHMKLSLGPQDRLGDGEPGDSPSSHNQLVDES